MAMSDCILLTRGEYIKTREDAWMARGYDKVLGWVEGADERVGVGESRRNGNWREEGRKE